MFCLVVLFTSDIHCAVDKGFGIAGLAQIRESLEKKGYETILVDDGDAIQGEPLGTLSNGEAMLKLMNDAHYDVAIPGNHEFDYGMDNFLSLAEEAEFQYISCNFNKRDKKTGNSKNATHKKKELPHMRQLFIYWLRRRDSNHTTSGL